MLTNTRNLFGLAFVVLLITIAPQIARAQPRCGGSRLTYVLRDERGKVMDANVDGLWTSFIATDWNFAEGESSVPPDLRKLSGKLNVMSARKYCVFDEPVKIQMTMSGKSMNLIFHPDNKDERAFIVDSLPFQQGTFEINLPASSGSPGFFPPQGWKKISNSAEAIAPYAIASISGRIIDSISGKPVAGARVYLNSRPYYQAASWTDGKGDFNLTHIRTLKLDKMTGVSVVALHADYEKGYTVIVDSETGKPFQSVSDVTVKLAPLVSVSGRIVDETSGATPPGLDKLRLTFKKGGEKYLWGDAMTDAERKAVINPDGMFTAKTAAGKNKLSLYDDADPWKGYELAVDYGLQYIEVDKAGTSDLVLKVRKQKN